MDQTHTILCKRAQLAEFSEFTEFSTTFGVTLITELVFAEQLPGGRKDFLGCRYFGGVCLELISGVVV